MEVREMPFRFLAHYHAAQERCPVELMSLMEARTMPLRFLAHYHAAQEQCPALANQNQLAEPYH